MELKIIDYGYDGEGVAKQDGKTVFVPFTILDEIVDAQIVKNNSKFSFAYPQKILKPSPIRVASQCPYFEKCGGCNFWHIEYEEELKIKKLLIERQLKKVGFENKISIISAGYCEKYRNKVTLRVKNNKLGYIGVDNEIVNIDFCPIAHDLINDAIGHINTFLQAAKPPITEVVIRTNGGQRLVLFKTKSKNKINFQGLQIMLGAKSGIYCEKQGEIKHVCGIKFLEFNEFGMSCLFDVKAFHQINDVIGEKLYSKVSSLVKEKNNTVINCYSGGGTLSGVIAKNSKRVFGVELGKNEHKSAEKLKENNRINNLYNICGIVQKFCQNC